MNINYTSLINPLLKVVKFILNKNGLSDSNLYKKTQIVIQNNKISIIMPEYAKFVNDGRRAGKMPPVKVILDWIRRKNINVPRGFTQESFAWAVSKSIAEKGIKARPFIVELRNNIVDIIKSFVQLELQNTIIVKLKK